MIGGMQLRALYRERVQANGAGQMSTKQFHDAILTQGPIAPDLIRARLLGTRLERDSNPVWKFTVDDSPVLVR
jgi:hypothetical protein